MVNSETRRRQVVCFAISVYALAIYAVYNAARTSVSFLQATIKLTTGFNVVILTVFTLLNSAIVWKLSTLLLFGNLRLIEYEHIFERLPFTIINTVFMSSMFYRPDFFLVALFGLILLYMKVFHWILGDRLEALLQTIQESTSLRNLIFTRFTFNLLLLAFLDYQIFSRCISASLSKNDNDSSKQIHLMASMEFAMLLIDLLNLAMHTILNFYEFYKTQAASHFSSVDPSTDEDETEDVDVDTSPFAGLEGKFMYERVIDLFTRFLKTLIHAIMLIPFKMSLLLVKDVFWDILTLWQNVSSLWKIWRNNRQLDEKLKTMTPAELLETDNICIICMDELCEDLEEVAEGPNRYKVAKGGKYKPKKLPCGHVLHLFCLKNWMERSQTCPICRLPVFDENGNVQQSQNSTTSHPADTPMTTTMSTTTTDISTDSTATTSSSHTSTQQTTNASTPTPTATNQDVNGLSNWRSCPVREVKDNTFTFNVVDSISGNPLRADLTFGGDNDNNETQKITVPNECIHHLESIEGLKKRISELETQVKELRDR